MIQIGEIIVLLGLGFLVYAVFLINFIAGLFATGIVLILIGMFVVMVGMRIPIGKSKRGGKT